MGIKSFSKWIENELITATVITSQCAQTDVVLIKQNSTLLIKVISGSALQGPRRPFSICGR